MAQTTSYKAKISPRNQAFVKKIKELADKFQIIGVVDVEGLPAPQFQRIRGSLKKSAEVLIVKKNLAQIVFKELEKSRPGISELLEKLQGVAGLVFTNDNPFTLYKFISKNKSSAPAKAGAVAPKEIIVPAGPTSFSPGPIIGELGALKIKAGVDGGKVAIKEDSVVAKEGDTISEQLAGVLTRLGIEPMEVGLNIKALYEKGTIYGRDVLEVDEEAILSDLKNEAARCFSLSVGLNYPTKENIELLVQNAARDALGFGLGIHYPAAETIKQLLSKANAQGNNLAAQLPEEARPAGLSLSAEAPVASESSAPVANEESTEKKEKPASSESDVAAGFGGFM